MWLEGKVGAKEVKSWIVCPFSPWLRSLEFARSCDPVARGALIRLVVTFPLVLGDITDIRLENLWSAVVRHFTKTKHSFKKIEALTII